MNDQQAATALLGLEECIEEYIAGCRARVDGFVEGHFSLRETVAFQKQSLASDLLCYPVNALWAIPSLFMKKFLEVPVKLGWRSGADLIGLLPAGLKTRYQKEIERLIAVELFAVALHDGRPTGVAERAAGAADPGQTGRPVAGVGRVVG